MSSAATNLIEPCVHGGEVFEVAREHGIDPRKILDFSSNVNPLGPPSSALKSLKKALWMIPHYPDSSYHDFRKAAAEYADVSAIENVIEGNGSMELIYLFAELFVRGGDRTLIPIPTFGEYERAVRSRGGKPVCLECEPSLTVAVDRVASELDKGCKALFLSSPNNPSSKTIPKKDLLALIDLAFNRGVQVLLDETFIEFTDDHESGLSSRAEEFPNLFIIRSLTKIFALTGLRIGYGLASRKLAEQLRRAKMPWSVNVLAQEAGIAALHDRAFMESSRRVIEKERNFLYSGLKKIPRLTPFSPEANFILSRISQGLTAEELKAALLEKRILIRDCSSFKGLGKDYFRVSVKLRKQNTALLSALKEVLS